MEDFLEWLSNFGPLSAIVFLLLVLIIIILIRIKDITLFFTWLMKNKNSRSCGDCILILFGIREKYELESSKIIHDILKSQMSYVEQKQQELLLLFCQSYQDDLEKLGKDRTNEEKSEQFGYYQQALKCAFGMIKDEVRKSFKENGFIDLNDSEFLIYIKSKLQTFISIVKSYLTTYYFQNNNTIVSLKYRFENLDHTMLNDMMFNIFGNARNIVKESILKEQELKDKFKKEIDDFIEGRNKNVSIDK